MNTQSKKSSTDVKSPGTKKKTSTRKSAVEITVARIIGSALVVVESPTKARTLTRFLDSSYKVIASGGHIIDLPPKEIGVDIDHDFKPKYKLLPGKNKIAKILLTAAAQVERIYLATDPDREGEAIAWHISRHIGRRDNSGIMRVQFHEITRRAVLEAIANPSSIDLHKVDAQQARRIMDRLVGYQVSPFLWKTVTGGLSAGRVQSVALRLICEREAEIEAFVREEYWTIDGMFSGQDREAFQARLHRLDGEKVKIPNEESSQQVIQRVRDSRYKVLDIKKTQKKRNPYPPYITSTLQQDAGRRLGFPAKRIMAIAQKLYEGVEIGERGQTGLITYMRTDSTRVSTEAVTTLRNWIDSNYGAPFLSPSPRKFTNKKGKIQDAHEAIRPTDISLAPDVVKPFLKDEEFKLYDLIWRRFVATQMQSAEFNVTAVTIGDSDTIEFRASGEVMTFPGYLRVYKDVQINGEDEDEKTSIPANLKIGDPLDLIELKPEQHFTQPPPRYNDASLVKALDELGIGRPSTYATIISTLTDRKYVEREKRNFLPSDLGKTVNKILVSAFPDIFNVTFTARMEEELDKIETGGDWLKVIREFYEPFNTALQAVQDKSHEIKKESLQSVGRKCPDCESELVYRWGKRGRFISCSSFPKCHYAENIDKSTPVKVDVKCPQCGGEMVIRVGKFGRFIGCTNYPKCRGILPYSTGCRCPNEGCEGDLIERKSKKGRTFFGCNKYPNCKFTSWDNPVEGPCPECHAPTIFEKNQSGAIIKHCARCNWKSEE